MHDEKNLQKKTIKELKKIADQYGMKYTAKAKKTDLVKLLLSYEKIDSQVQEKKQSTEKESSSQSSPVYHAQNEEPPHTEQSPHLPDQYHKDKLVLMIRDPYWGFVYWELTQNLIHENNLNQEHTYLRVYDISACSSIESCQSYFDIKLTGAADNWYINFPKTNCTYIVDLGYFKGGQFITLLRSNPASNPRDDVSDQLDQEWMLNDEQFNLILKASGAGHLFEQIGSQELMKFIAGNVAENTSSHASSKI